MTIAARDIHRLEVAIRAAASDCYSVQPATVFIPLDLAERIVDALIDGHPDYAEGASPTHPARPGDRRPPRDHAGQRG